MTIIAGAAATVDDDASAAEEWHDNDTAAVNLLRAWCAPRFDGASRYGIIIVVVAMDMVMNIECNRHR